MTYPMSKTLEIVKFALDWNQSNYKNLKQFTTDQMAVACRDMVRFLIQSDNDDQKKQVYIELIKHLEGYEVGQPS